MPLQSVVTRVWKACPILYSLIWSLTGKHETKQITFMNEDTSIVYMIHERVPFQHEVPVVN